jgi:hypothetical protein
MSRKNDPYSDFAFDRSAHNYTRNANSEKEKYYYLKRQLLEEKLDQEAQKQKIEEKKQREETQKLLDFYKTQMEELTKARETAVDQSQTSSVIKGPVDVRSVQSSQHAQTFIDSARQVIKSSNNGE